MNNITSENTPKISIIVPAYNVEQYIEKCLKSIVGQTIKDIEIIIIDDGSTDDTKNIINKFVKSDKRIKFIEQKNQGPSIARNRGLEIAKGEYIGFVDSDDYVDFDFFEKLYNSIIKNNSDIACASIVRKRKNSQKDRIRYSNETIATTLEEKIKLCDIPKCCYVWNKIYKTSLLENSTFKTHVYYEDVLWLPEIVKRALKIVTVADTNYYYIVNSNSIVKKTPSSKKQEDNYNAMKYIIKFFKENNLSLSENTKNVTRFVKYFLNIPILKIKEKEDIETILLFGAIPIFRKKLNKNMEVVD